MKRRIIDAHHHLWDLDACHYPWLMEKGVVRFFGDPEPIQRNYLAADLLKDAAAYDLVGSVHIQVGVADGDEVSESRWLDSVANTQGLPSAIVAFCDLSSRDAQQILDAQQALDRVRGIRHIIGRSAEEDAKTGSDALLDNPRWLDNLASLRDRGLSFDLQLIPPQTRRAAAVLESVPGLQVALCHCGSPWDQTASGIASWRAGLKQLAENPDVFCKISGLAMFNRTWVLDDIRRLADTCIEIFTPERCMFGSNFPVDKLHKSYDEVWQAYEAIAAPYSEREQALLFAGNATAFYRID